MRSSSSSEGVAACLRISEETGCCFLVCATNSSLELSLGNLRSNLVAKENCFMPSKSLNLLLDRLVCYVLSNKCFHHLSVLSCYFFDV